MSAVKATPFRSPSKTRPDPLKLAQQSANSATGPRVSVLGFAGLGSLS